MYPTKADYKAAVNGEKPWPVSPTPVDFEVPEVKGVVLKDSLKVPDVPGEEDGFTNHEYRLNQGGLNGGDLLGTRQVSNRVIVIAPTIEDVVKFSAALPEFFRVHHPISLPDAIEQNIRPEPCQIIHVTREEVNTYRDEKRGRVFFLAYAIFENIEGYGGWVDLRDQNDCKWGRNPVRHAPGCTRSFQVLNGETTIEEIKAKCGFQ
ncbi:hypothetical protein ST201phi2-1p328 [Pseudomonas phage 201phi2-1]|uniref:Uncharacterized protein n=1 Tax=Pseudomonas phage 201phi2-1 TaxID=198110 RepID=B3FJI8_BP201|nr:hypothetical protein ST201phi2-1p328 [Pseudomonas phage 201phi2-1]ABY63153.1 hypothetical protein 201phi2-1p328 [Pseudomonas phage 201phi2-1]